MSTTFRAGLAVLGLVSLADVAAPFLTDGTTPPMFIALISCALGVISLVLVILAWRGATAAAVALVVVRLVSALSALPAFLVTGVPVVAMVVAGIFIAVTVAGAGLLLGGLRRPAVAATP